jgi:hypothetical protein
MKAFDFPSILTDSSRSLMDYTAAMIGDDQKLFGDLLELAYQQKSPLCMRAARVADACCERNPDLIRPHLLKMVRSLPDLKDMAVKRVFMHILVRDSWVEDDEAMGKLVDTLFLWIGDERQAISVQAYALVILENIAGILPDLKFELIAVLEETLTFWDSPGLQNLGKKMIKRLRKGKEK